MKCTSTLFLLFSFFTLSIAQSTEISGSLIDDNDQIVEFANVVMYNQADSSMVKVETTDENGVFRIINTPAGNYYLEATMVGFMTIRKENLNLTTNPKIDLGQLKFLTASIELETAVVTAQRAMVEIKPDKTVFNVQGTINSTGENGLNLLRKAPGVLIDNNNNISVLGRNGVLIYVDGKRLPLAGADLSNYLESLTAEQIDRIDIITNPGAKYEAEGNAGIIDIRLKRDKSLGVNGSINGTIGRGRFATGNAGASGNYRNKNLNSFGTLGFGKGTRYNEMDFQNFQNGIFLDETSLQESGYDNFNFRWGTDFFLSKNTTIGFLIGGNMNDGSSASDNRSRIAAAELAPIDSILVAENTVISDRDGQTYNINYAHNAGGSSLNIDFDYGRYRNFADNNQPNRYFDANLETLFTERLTAYETPVEIDIFTAKTDYEKELWGGKIGLGAKYSKVKTDNTFLFYNLPDGERLIDNGRSNQFTYDEKVYAAYISYTRPLNEKWNASGGLRLERTDALGDLRAFDPSQQQPPVDLDYINAFPTIGLSYNHKPGHAFNFNAGRRINRPDYNILNPFEEQLSELSFSKGNPFLQPEIVNNAELGYTLKYRYNFKLSYSRTTNQITRLIAPDDEDPRAGFITWDNLAEQDVWAINIAAPITVNKWWSAFFNVSGSHKYNKAEYENGATVDVKALSYNLFTQQTFKLPKGFTGEVSGWFAGPGVWGGVFRYKISGSLNLGLQKKFMKDQMTVRLSANDLFYSSGWRGVSEFDGLRSFGRGNWDSRRATLSVNMKFGNSNVKSRNRKTGIEEEAKRVGG